MTSARYVFRSLRENICHGDSNEKALDVSLKILYLIRSIERFVMFIEKRLDAYSHWINIDSDDITETSQIYQRYDIDKETIEYALDKNERAHMDYNREDGTVTFIYNVLDITRDKNYYETIPMTFIVQEKRLVTISNSENAYIIRQMARYLENHEELSIYKFLFAGLEMISNAYYPIIESLDKAKDQINLRLRETTSKENLFALSDLETGMVYLSAAAKQNRMLLEHIHGHAVYRRFNEVEKEQFEDAMIEARQLVAMTDLIAQVLQQLSGSYNNILNNNLNDNLTRLNIMSVLLAVLAVITGFFGMNIPLPFTESRWAWLILIVLSILLWGGLAYYLKQIVKKQ